MGDTPTYTLSITGEGLSLEREVDQATALAVVNLVLTGQKPQIPTQHIEALAPRPAGIPHPAVAAQGQAPSPPVSVKEYTHELGAQNNADFILAFAAYITSREGRERFTRDELKSFFPKAGEPVPKNYTRDFGNTVDWGWVAEDHEQPGQWYITRAGTNALENQFAKETRKTTRARRRSKPTEVSETE